MLDHAGSKPPLVEAPHGIKDAEHPMELDGNLGPLVQLQGLWNSECGPMAIIGQEVHDGGGEAAYLAVTADGRLELRFGPDTWTSGEVNPDRIEWEGGGGVWTRARAAEGPPRDPVAPDSRFTGATYTAPATATASAPSPSPTRGGSPITQTAPLAEPRVIAQKVHRVVLPGPPGSPLVSSAQLPQTSSSLHSAQALAGSPWGGRPAGHWGVPSSSGVTAPSQWQPLSAQTLPPPQAPQLPPPQLALLEAKVDFLTQAVADLQGEIWKMMQARRGGQQMPQHLGAGLAPPPSQGVANGFVPAPNGAGRLSVAQTTS